MSPQARRRWMMAVWVCVAIGVFMVVAPLDKIAIALHQ